ncbi:MAG: YeeE/YedE family protein [Actinomycetia bacterium]|nr:YeeE/YedE family protein [Actinomycetes bacterium]
MAIKPVGPSILKGKAPDPRPFPNAYLVGVGLGVVLFLSVLVTGDGLGASGAVQRVWAWFENLIVPHHVDTNIYLVNYAGGEAQALNHWIVMLAIGVLIGGFISGLFGQRVYTEIVKGPRISNRTRLMFALLGGSLVGFGARFARGCTSSQGLSGSALLSVGSWIFMMAFFAGALIAAPFFRKLWND